MRTMASRGQRRRVELGRVARPLRGTIDVDVCANCGRLRSCDRDEEDAYLVCRPPVSALPIETQVVGPGL